MTATPHPDPPPQGGREKLVKGPDARGRYGGYGGRFIPETLMAAVEELALAFDAAQRDPGFQRDFESLSRSFSGRPTPIYLADRLSERAGGAPLWLKREDLCHTGAHKINNALGQVLLARRMGKQRIIAETGGGSNAIGIFATFYDDPVRMIGVEAAGRGLTSGAHAASIVGGRPGVLHGSFSYLLQDDDGQVLATHSISAGLDYPGVGPEHAFLHDAQRAEYVGVTDQQALDAFHETTRLEGIIPALESSHAIAYAMTLAPQLPPDAIVLINLSGRGDKDLDIVRSAAAGV